MLQRSYGFWSAFKLELLHDFQQAYLYLQQSEAHTNTLPRARSKREKGIRISLLLRFRRKILRVELEGVVPHVGVSVKNIRWDVDINSLGKPDALEDSLLLAAAEKEKGWSTET